MNLHIIRVRCTHGDEMLAKIKGQLFTIVHAASAVLRRTDNPVSQNLQDMLEKKGIQYGLFESSSSLCPYVNRTRDLESVVCQLL